jgi:acyl carrier protein
MDGIISANLRLFLEERRIKGKAPLTMDTRIEEDLGITGVDARDLIMEYGKKFNVVIAKFMAADYFEAEGSFPLFNFNKKPNKTSLTVYHLEKGIIAGALDENVIGSDHYTHP